MTFLEMQQSVGYLINQDVSTDNLTVTETEVKLNLNRGYQKVVNRIASLAQDYYIRLSKTNLVADQSLYGLPSDYRKMIRVEIAPEDADERYRVTRTDINSYGHPVDYYGDETEPTYTIRGDNIEIKPTPEDSITDGLWMYYVETVSDLSADDDEPNLPPEFSDLPVEYATAKAKARLGLMDEAQLHLAEFYRELEEMTASLTNTNSDDPEQVVVRDPYFD
jgi:hypothetical protein